MRLRILVAPLFVLQMAGEFGWGNAKNIKNRLASQN